MYPIRPIREVRLNDTASVGGKAAALGELANAGFRVPDGFVIPAETECDEAKILAAFRALESPLVAVRSSATVEDGKVSSWAGQFETFLNVSEREVVDRIAECRASASSARAKLYGQIQCTAGEHLAVAVIVQAMVPAEVAGVAFSLNPVTGNGKPVIEAVRGLGDELVSGRAEPEEGLLTTEQEGEIVTLIRRIESRFGYAVDMEWALARGVIYILQARPITTLETSP